MAGGTTAAIRCGIGTARRSRHRGDRLPLLRAEARLGVALAARGTGHPRRVLAS
jgi:hypothetical protein